jgi:hypothetical protein
MKNVFVLLLAGVMLFSLCSLSAPAKSNREPGGPAAFIVGCCWGIREGSQWNEGSDMHWREWCRIVPIVNIVIGIWDGLECYDGVTAREWADQNGANWY